MRTEAHPPMNSTDQLAVDTIRTLSIDAVQKANSGHPGAPMGLAPVAYSLWQEALRYDPAAPAWPARDRFVLSGGHASALLYSLLHLAGVVELDRAGRPTGKPAVALEDLQAFRQLHSKTPGHPEHGHTTGVETTTGPLGQGVANSVGMAMAARWWATRYAEHLGHRVWAICGDGDLMEGVAYEAASLAGHLALSNLCWIYDSNRITIEGRTDLAFGEDVGARFEAMGWRVLRVKTPNDLSALTQAWHAVLAERAKPCLVIVETRIGYGSPKKEDSHHAHGEPLGVDEVAATKTRYGWDPARNFHVPEGVRELFAARLGARGKALRAEWERVHAAWRAAHPAQAAELDLAWSGRLPQGWDADVPCFPADAKGLATRDAGGKVLEALAKRVPWLVGGSADLAPSTKTRLSFEGAGDLSAATPGGRNLHYGIREHAMAAVLNGMVLSGLRAYGATFLVFCDYLRPALRLSALMGAPVVHVFTHDSIGVGEDGPTHQPIEQLAAMRAMIGLATIRPCDANETAEAWRVALERVDGPTALVLTRQALPTLDRAECASAAGLRRGGYVLLDAPAPRVILVASGSEVALCVAAKRELDAQGLPTRVVSMPSFELFEAQDAAYKEAVLPAGVRARVAVEAGVRLGWERHIGERGAFVGMSSYGASAPAGALMKHYGLTVENVVAQARRVAQA